MTNNRKHTVALQKSYTTRAAVIFNLISNDTLFKLTGADTIESDFNIGKPFRLTFNNRGIIHGKFIKIAQNEIILEWNVDGFQRPAEIGTIVEIVLREENEICILKLCHTNISIAEVAAIKKRAWTEILDDIVQYVTPV